MFERFGLGSLCELASLHEIQRSLSVKDVIHDAVTQHLVTGACEGTEGEMCRSTRLACLAISVTFSYLITRF